MTKEIMDRNVANPIMRAEHVKGGYGSVRILNDISLTLDHNEIISIIGPNGCGKSTFLKVLYGLATHHGGNMEYESQDITGVRTDKLVDMGMSYVPQVNNVFSDLTIKENLEMGAYLREDDYSDDIDRVFQIFPELKGRRFELASNLSGGQRQMLAMGRALMTQPRLMLLDEPTAALSPLLVQVLLDKIEELRDEGMSIVLVEQNAKSALAKSDYGYVFANGRIVFHDDADIILNDKNLGELFLGSQTEYQGTE